jgi:hypothetical protein
MSDIIENFLETYGPSLSSEVSDYLTKTMKISPAAARKRVSRVAGEVKRLAYVTFPRRARFMYLRQQFGSPSYWKKLTHALLQTNTAYGHAISALRQREGLIPEAHFAIACGAPVKQARHLPPETIFKRLSEAGLLEKIEVPSLGNCISLVQAPGHYDFIATAVRARLITEEFLLTAIRDWVRKLGIVSYDKVATRKGEALPMVGTFAWDLTAPSYLGFMVKPSKQGNLKPGFVASDIYLGRTLDADGARPFINKCKSLRRLRNVGACMQIFVADNYSDEAFRLMKENGIIPATPRNLFGHEVAEGLIELTSVLRNAASTAIAPEKFDTLFKKLGRIEGAATQLRGTLFEFLVADVARKTLSPNVKLNRIFKSADNKKAEADVIAVKDDVSVTFIECKGYSPYAELPDDMMQRWLHHNIPIFYKAARAHPDWQRLNVHFEFWATAALSSSALTMFDAAQKVIKERRYTMKLLLAPQILKICESTNDHGLVTAFRKHFMKLGTKTDASM